MPPLLLLSHAMGVSSAPPRLSSDPRPAACAEDDRLPQVIESGSKPPPLERIEELEGSGIAGGRGNICAPDVTCTTRSMACR